MVKVIIFIAEIGMLVLLGFICSELHLIKECVSKPGATPVLQVEGQPMSAVDTVSENQD